MKTSQDLKNLLQQIDHKGYPAYKDTKGAYDFGKYVLSIDHVQGDPFASPSKVSVYVKGNAAAFPANLYEVKSRNVAFGDQLLRAFARRVAEDSFKAKGSGKSGLISVTRPGQEVFERTACQVDMKSGNITVRMEIGFPANGRTINSRELIKILFDFLPVTIEHTLFYSAVKKDAKEIAKIKKAVELAEDQEYLREHLKEQGLVAFVADDSILPRESGVSSRPMKNAIKFSSPQSLRTSFTLPNAGTICGMSIKEGITLIVGGGYHGKSTLLKALEQGVYNHIVGDGREYVVTEPTAMKLRAEDGRSIKEIDISMFIRDLPNGKDTTCFSTEDASGSTSEAANVIEAMLAGSQTFLIDEDTSATNFMIRDELMQSVVSRAMEPIIPYIDRIRALYEQKGISTILVAGSSGSYFAKADSIIQMNCYEPVDISEFAKKKAEEFYGKSVVAGKSVAQEILPEVKKTRIVSLDRDFARNPKNKIKAMGHDTISVNHDEIDLHDVEQLVDSEQANALAQILKYAKLTVFDGKKTLMQGVDEITAELEKNGFSRICKELVPGNLAIPRKQEIAAMFERYRQL